MLSPLSKVSFFFVLPICVCLTSCIVSVFVFDLCVYSLLLAHQCAIFLRVQIALPPMFRRSLYRSYSFINLFSSSGKPFDRPYNFKQNAKFINGLTEYELRISENISLAQSNVFHKTATQDGHATQLEFVNLRPGSVVAIR